jgi:hypothetical protein
MCRRGRPGQRLIAGDLTAVEIAVFFLERLERLGPMYRAVRTLPQAGALGDRTTSRA